MPDLPLQDDCEAICLDARKAIRLLYLIQQHVKTLGEHIAKECKCSRYWTETVLGYGMDPDEVVLPTAFRMYLPTGKSNDAENGDWLLEVIAQLDSGFDSFVDDPETATLSEKSETVITIRVYRYNGVKRNWANIGRTYRRELGSGDGHKKTADRQVDAFTKAYSLCELSSRSRVDQRLDEFAKQVSSAIGVQIKSA